MSIAIRGTTAFPQHLPRKKIDFNSPHGIEFRPGKA
jgi:hypothetical protein